MPQLGSGPTSDNQGSGFYSKSDYVDLVRYAKARGVTVIPEINMPAHARAAVVSMEARYKRLMAEGKEAEANQFRLTDPADTSNVTSVGSTTRCPSSTHASRVLPPSWPR